MRKKLLAIIITIPLIFSSCASSGGKNIGKEEDFKKVLSDINKSAEELDKKDIKIDEKYKGWFERNEDFTKEECEELFKYFANYEDGNFKSSEENEYSYTKVLTYEKAKEDVDILFKLFRNCYAAYGYFGGDDAFLKAKEDILKELKTENQIMACEFYKLIFSKLDFFKDKHTNYEVMNKFSKGYYICKDVDFFKDEKGYYKIVENIPRYINKINNEKDISKFMKHTIDKKGRLVYTIAMLSESSTNNEKQALLGIDVDVEYLNGKNKVSEKVNLKALKGSSQYAKEINYSVKNGVPISKIGRMYNMLRDDKEEREFVDTADKLKNYPVSVIDLLGNAGGYMNIGEAWFEKYTGGKYKGKRVNLNLSSNLVREYREKVGKRSSPDELFQIESLGLEKDNRIKNKNIIFLLVDNLDESASELFIENMRKMDNVILVGTNTGGCTLTLDICEYVLKNSKIIVPLGSVFHMTPYFDGFECKGFEPDILVDSSESLERVQKLIEYYKLNEKK